MSVKESKRLVASGVVDVVSEAAFHDHSNIRLLQLLLFFSFIVTRISRFHTIVTYFGIAELTNN